MIWDDLDWPDGQEVTHEEFWSGCHRRFGAANPELMRVPFWEKAVRNRKKPFRFRGRFEGYPFPGEPIWTFSRIGRTSTVVRGGVVVSIGGEHEDGYDPDFMIYNDVIAQHGGRVWIFGYPREIFPPTDFHTATYIDDEAELHFEIPFEARKFCDSIVVIGGLGYEEDIRWSQTPVYRLRLDDFRMEVIETSGENPGWIHNHSAALVLGGRIRIIGGEVLLESGEGKANADEFELDLATLAWTKLPRRPEMSSG